MSDGSLLSLGCAVSFIAVSGFYVYLRDCWTRSEQPIRVKERSHQVASRKLKDVA
jgi:hypothetical protein